MFGRQNIELQGKSPPLTSLPRPHLSLAVSDARAGAAAEDRGGQGRILLDRVHQRRDVRSAGDHQRVLQTRRDRQGSAERG